MERAPSTILGELTKLYIICNWSKYVTGLRNATRNTDFNYLKCWISRRKTDARMKFATIQ